MTLLLNYYQMRLPFFELPKGGQQADTLSSSAFA